MCLNTVQKRIRFVSNLSALFTRTSFQSPSPRGISRRLSLSRLYIVSGFGTGWLLEPIMVTQEYSYLPVETKVNLWRQRGYLPILMKLTVRGVFLLFCISHNQKARAQLFVRSPRDVSKWACGSRDAGVAESKLLAISWFISGESLISSKWSLLNDMFWYVSTNTRSLTSSQTSH